VARRREFLQVGLALAVLPLTQTAPGRSVATWRSGSGASAWVDALVTLQVLTVIFDEELGESCLFAEKATRLGLRTLSFSNGDATDLWYHELDPIWREQPIAIAGLTRFGPLFVLERLAWDRGMRVVYRAELAQSSGAEPLYSWVIGPRERV